VNAYQHHLKRVTSTFKAVISAENAELLAGLLDDSGNERGAA
jgi:hypothetical protein